MNYHTDRPIENCDQDLLGRSTFSKQLGKSLFEYDSSDGLVIGLYGKWGSGKTSVINMAISELNRLSSTEENEPLTMSFSPWNYSDKNNLISIFFQQLKNTIDYQDNEELKKKVGTALSDYADAFDALSIIPVIGTSLASVTRAIAKGYGEKFKTEQDLSKTREILEKALLAINKKIIVVIDDIDRLTKSQIRDIFQLVKQVADFPNIIYVLAMDKEVVSKALSENSSFDGNEYLEKIIQIPLELPELRKSKIHDIFLAKLDQINQEINLAFDIDYQYFSTVFMNCIAPYIRTLRDVNRVINIFQFKYRTLYQEISFEDMIGITTIEVLEPELYKWIGQNKEYVCGGIQHDYLSLRNREIDYRKQYSMEFSRLGLDPEKTIKCISTMFPVVAKDVKENNPSCLNSPKSVLKMRIANEERYNLCFILDFDDIKVSKITIKSCIYELNKDDLRTVIDVINQKGSIIYFLEELLSLVDDIPYERLGLIASVLIDVQGEFSGKKMKSIFTISACQYADMCVFSILRKLQTDDERNGIIRSVLEQVNKKTIGTISNMIYRMEFAYGRLGSESENKEDQIINLRQLENLEELYVIKVKDITSSETILDLKDFSVIILLWESFDKEGAQKFVSKLIKDDFHKLKYICTFARRWEGSNERGWFFYPERYTLQISDEEIYNLIQNYDKKKINELTDIDQIKLASFVLNYQEGNVHHVNEQEAKKLVEEWKRY